MNISSFQILHIIFSNLLWTNPSKQIFNLRKKLRWRCSVNHFINFTTVVVIINLCSWMRRTKTNKKKIGRYIIDDIILYLHYYYFIQECIVKYHSLLISFLIFYSRHYTICLKCYRFKLFVIPMAHIAEGIVAIKKSI